MKRIIQEKIIWWIRCLGTTMAYGGNRQRKKDRLSLWLVKYGNRVHFWSRDASWQHTINHYGIQDWAPTIQNKEELESFFQPSTKKNKRGSDKFDQYHNIKTIDELEKAFKPGIFFRLLTR